MISAEYTRTTGRSLTYRIRADDWGGYRIYLGELELASGRDTLSAHGSHRAPNKRKAIGAMHIAKEAIESLRFMREF
ncbi:hypothetical protein LZ009_11005 [Ramlibacter sp. XY19]|uniref:hypothetical protein n=1 Tax=Ramlibacter paludis TaxID=2908000 RepID=UPI0023DC5DB6|nr:hypothetical protein [Ramlibacter paludis]MCG2593310.1 hypothetical protein [Ramlibacter paludis]